MITIISHNIKSQDSIYQPLIDNLNLIFGDKINLQIINSLNCDFSRFILQNNIKKWTFSFNEFGPLKYICDILYVLFGLVFFNDNHLIIALNPLNAFSAILYKKLLFKNVRVIYYIPDYSPSRFKNKHLNNIYHAIESFASRTSDAVVCVSTRVYEMKRNINENCFLIKNYPPKSILNKNILNIEKKYDLVLVGFLEDYYQFDVVKELIEKLNLSLLIVGGGSKLDEIKNYFNNSKNVIFAGHLDKLKVFEYLNLSNIGIALYNSKNEYNQFGDSVKCREYIAAGLPIITTNNHSTSKEIAENILGEVLTKMNIDSLEFAYHKIVTNMDIYKKNSESYFERDGDVEDGWKMALDIISS